jgi:nucleotide-binding universal stress UspA family protein
MVKKVLVAVDGSEQSLKAVDQGADIALKYGAELYLIHVVEKIKLTDEFKKFMDVEKVGEPPEYLYLTRIGEKVLKKAEEIAKSKGIREPRLVIEEGDPAGKIAEYARLNQVDWIFLGSRGLSGIGGLLMGSVSNKVCHIAEATCITVR